MNVTLENASLEALVAQQIRSNFLLTNSEELTIAAAIPEALRQTKTCFQSCNNKYYTNEDGVVQFNPYHSGQYTAFLYFLSRALISNDHASLADRAYYLNRMLNGLDLFYQVEMPPVFMLDHPLGSILGRASYGNYFVFNQQCTVGGNHDIYPKLGEYVTLFAGATVIGNSTIGNNVYIAAGAYVKDEDIPDNTLVFGRSPNLTLKTKPPEYFYRESPFNQHRPAGDQD